MDLILQVNLAFVAALIAAGLIIDMRGKMSNVNTSTPRAYPILAASVLSIGIAVLAMFFGGM